MVDNLGSRKGESSALDNGVAAPSASPDDAADCLAVVLDRLFSTSARTLRKDLDHALSIAGARSTHSLRVTLRRLRVFLTAFRSVVRRKLKKRLIRNAKLVCRTLSPLRNADAVIADVVGAVTAVEADTLQSLKDWREGVRIRVRQRLTALNLSQLHDDVSELANGGWRRRGRTVGARLAAPGDVMLTHAMNKAWRQAKPRGKRLAELDEAECHWLRKDLKTLRYLVEVAAPGDIAMCLPLLRKMQARLGRVSDFDMLKHLDRLREEAPGGIFLALRRRLEATGYRENAMRKSATTFQALAKQWPVAVRASLQ
jgi:CHAD domain-containing protein